MQLCARHLIPIATESVQTPGGFWLVCSLVHEYVLAQLHPKSSALTSLCSWMGGGPVHAP